MKILLVEDDPRLNTLITNVLFNEGFECNSCYSAEEALVEFRKSPPDLIISDILLPGINGLELVLEIRNMDKHVPILMLSALGDTDDKVQGLDLGADDYMVKPFETKELTARIRVLLKRSKHRSNLDSERLSYADIQMDLKAKVVTRQGQEINLTPKEFNLLACFLNNPERVLSRQEIAEKVWDTHFDTGTNFIDVYINYLRKKIDKDFDKKLIHTKSGMGFVLREEH